MPRRLTVARVREALAAVDQALRDLHGLQQNIETAELAYLDIIAKEKSEADIKLFRLRAAQMFYGYGTNEYRWEDYIRSHVAWGKNGLSTYPEKGDEYDDAIVIKDDVVEIVYQGPGTQAGPGDVTTIKFPHALVDGKIEIGAYVHARAKQVWDKIEADRAAAAAREEQAVRDTEAAERAELARLTAKFPKS